MWDLIKKWWNRKWSDWEFYKHYKNYYSDRYEIYVRVSNDGLRKYKKIKVSSYY